MPKTENDHREMIMNDGDWPCWPRLPIKRPARDGSWPECAVMIAGYPNKIFLANLYATRDELLAAKTLEYSSVDAILIDGWIVD